LRKVSDYQTVMGHIIEEFDGEISRWIDLGYEPYGNPYCGTEEGTVIVFQAMIRYEEQS